MKKLINLVILLLLGNIALAQAPQGIPYQAVARNSSGTILASTAISVRFTIRDSIATGTIKYRETFSVTTTAQGMFSVNVGTGTVVSGTFAGINWGTNAKFMQVELDPAGGSSYIDMGTQQMMSVPYAMYAAAAPSSGGTVTSVTAGAGLSGGTITTSGTISMPNVGTAGTYGSGTQVPVITTDAQGRITGVTNTTITAGETGTVTNINTSAPLTGGPITSTGTIGLATAGTAGTYGSATQVPVITTDAYGRVTAATNTTITMPTVSGTTNYLSKFTSASAIGNSSIFEYGSHVGINTSTPSIMSKLHVSGVGTYSVAPYYQAGIVADGGAASASASGVYGEAGWRGVYGRNPGIAFGADAIGVQGRLETGSAYTYGYGIKGEAFGAGPINYGVFGNATSASSNNYGVYGTSTGTGYAGYFSGNVCITGSIAKGSGTFLIDHPLDPENKYLYHSFVESPDMMNIYNGNVVTDANGKATVSLPDYFEVLNKDFRYQLTVIGTFAQAIVAEKISGIQFKIQTDKPNIEVSWQVTGVRHDKYADAHRVVPEVEKEPQFKGHYLHAEEWGQAHSKSFDAITTPRSPENNCNGPQ